MAPVKKKGGCVKWGAIIGGVFIAAVACNAIIGGGDTTTSPAPVTTEVTNMSPAPLAQLPSETAAAPEKPAAVVEKPAEAPAAPEKPAAVAEKPAEAPKVTVEQKSALKKAESYSKTMHMSKAGIYHQLTSEYGEKFSPEAAQYAIDNLKADFNKNALEKAKSYQKNMSMSPDSIYDQLVSEYGEQFTPEEAQYAVDNLAP
ncbi:Ltp family lipoprotein [Corynebacterium kalinowskii]|nr:Ltp family lipoprotein [Corynebacterium kalinowskii]